VAYRHCWTEQVDSARRLEQFPEKSLPNVPMHTEHRCPLPVHDACFVRYHDEEWGRPTSDDNRLYEKVCLEGFQAGLSWTMILHKRNAFRDCFAGFDIDAVAGFGGKNIERLARDARIVRNRRKIESAIHNASRARELRDEFGSLARFFWSFEPPPDERPAVVTQDWLRMNPTTSASMRLAQALKSRGWRFVGPTSMYALMQALGLVNDHVHDCPVRSAVERERQAFLRPGLESQGSGESRPGGMRRGR